MPCVRLTRQTRMKLRRLKRDLIALATPTHLTRRKGREDALNRISEVTRSRVGTDRAVCASSPDQRLAVRPVHEQVQPPELIGPGGAQGMILELDQDDEIRAARRPGESLLLQQRIREELDLRLDEVVRRIDRRSGRPRV